MSEQNVIKFQTRQAPVIEFDPACAAWYVRFSRKKVARTKTASPARPGPIATIDFDEAGEVVGIELLGVAEFSFKMMRRLGIDPARLNLAGARIVPLKAAAMA